MAFYTKKPITVEAFRWFPGAIIEGVRRIPATKVDMSKTRGILFERPARYVVETLEGPVDLRPGDWVITGVKGEHYTCRDDIFRLTYEPAGLLGTRVAKKTNGLCASILGAVASILKRMLP